MLVLVPAATWVLRASGYVIKVRKALDDVFVFLYVLLLGVALRAIWTATVV